MARGHDLDLGLEAPQTLDKERTEGVGDRRDVRLESGRGLHDRDTYRYREATKEVFMDLAATLRRLPGAEERDQPVGHPWQLP
jgi:hypothetical protein